MLEDPGVRLAVIALAAVGAVVVARLVRRPRPAAQDIDLTGLGLPAGLVLFTSTDCANCAPVRTMLAVAGAKPREVTWELEPDTIARSGVRSVPLLVVVDASGAVIDQWSGLPPRSWVNRAVAQARRLER